MSTPQHGVTVNEVPTGVRPAVRTTAGLPFYVGTAPINLGDESFVSKPIVAYTLAEAQAKIGSVFDAALWKDYTLLEAVYAHFKLFNVGPIVLCNVLDPSNTNHVNSATNETHVFDSDGTVKISIYGDDGPKFGVLKSTVVVKVGGVTKNVDHDYTLAFDANGYLVISRVSGGGIALEDVMTVTFDYFDPSGVSASDIIGGYSGGHYTGIECVEQVYPRLRLVPGLLLAPGFSQEPTVGLRLQTKAAGINGAFKAIALCDIEPSEYEVSSYADVAAWKTDNGFTSELSANFWPMAKDAGGRIYHGSTLAACIINTEDQARGGVPYSSPSNKDAKITGTCFEDGEEVSPLTRPQANALNDQGVITFLNGFNGWRLWGNRTGCYPGNTDVKDAMLPVKRMFVWVANTTILTTDSLVDQPGNRRLIDLVLETMGALINGLIAAGALVDGKIEFRSEDNPTIDIADGKIVWHITLTPPSPGEKLVFDVEYDPAALSALFA